jgi:hypothetical protein
MGFFSRKIDKWAVKTQANEMSDFVSKLESMDGEDIGFVLAMAAHYRNGLSSGQELMNPIAFAAINPTAALQLNRAIRDLQKHGRQSEAAGVMIWLHTTRAASSLELRGLGRKMWRELERGFSHVGKGAAIFFNMTGIILDVENANRFPEGLTPEPV